MATRLAALSLRVLSWMTAARSILLSLGSLGRTRSGQRDGVEQDLEGSWVWARRAISGPTSTTLPLPCGTVSTAAVSFRYSGCQAQPLCSSVPWPNETAIEVPGVVARKTGLES
jgi:hypothetical protein